VNIRLSPIGLAALALAWLAAGAAAQPLSDARVAELIAQARAETQAPAGQAGRAVVDLRPDEAVRHALENNLDLKVERLNPQSFDIQLAQLKASYAPSLTGQFGQRSQTRTPTSQLNGGTRVITDTFTYNGGVTKNLPWFGANTSVSFSNNRTGTSDSFSLFNPQYNSSLTLNYTQPLLRNFKIDSTRQQFITTQISREMADVTLRALVTNIEANVRNAYWDLLYAVEAIAVERSSLALAEELVANNKIKVEIGTLAPLDVVQAEAEAATRRQSLATAEATLKSAELALKRLVVSGTDDPWWGASFNPVERPSFQAATVDIEAAVRRALSERNDLIQSRRSIESSGVNLKYLENQRLPALDLQASYGVQGLGGNQYERSGLGGTPTLVSSGGYPSALNKLLSNDFPTWNLQVNLTYPIGNSSADAQVAAAKLKMTQAEAQLKALELTVATDVTSAGTTAQSDLTRLQAAVAARELAQQKLEAEQTKLDVGMQTVYFVVQAQRDLRTAQNSELRALLDYRKALVDFERVQHVAKR